MMTSATSSQSTETPKTEKKLLTHKASPPGRSKFIIRDGGGGAGAGGFGFGVGVGGAGSRMASSSAQNQNSPTENNVKVNANRLLGSPYAFSATSASSTANDAARGKKSVSTATPVTPATPAATTITTGDHEEVDTDSLPATTQHHSNMIPPSPSLKWKGTNSFSVDPLFFATAQENHPLQKEMDRQIGGLLRKGSYLAVAMWLLGLFLIYRYAPADSWQLLEGTERNANGAVLAILLCTNVSRFLSLILQDKTLAFVNTGIMFGSLTVQLIAIMSISLMMFFPTPVMIDSVTGLRIHLVRWVEWIALAFLMTFLTESLDIPLQAQQEVEHGNQESSNNKMGKKAKPRPSWMAQSWIHGGALGLSTSAGLLFPFCPNLTCWMIVFTISWVLFSNLYWRLYQRYQRLSKMTPPPNSSRDHRRHQELFQETSMDDERAKYSLKTLMVCAFAWTFLAMGFSIMAYGHHQKWRFIMEDDAYLLVMESIFEIMSKVWYLSLLLETHSIVFDDATRTLRRLQEMKHVISAIWNTSSDAMIWCSFPPYDTNKEANATVPSRIQAIVSPSFFDLCQEVSTSGGKKSVTRASNRDTLVLQIDPTSGAYCHQILHFQLMNQSTVTRQDAIDFLLNSSTNHKSNGAEPPNDEKMALHSSDHGQKDPNGFLPLAELMEKSATKSNIQILVDLLLDAYNGSSGDHSSSLEPETTWKIEERTFLQFCPVGPNKAIFCEAKISPSNQHASHDHHCEYKMSCWLIALRDISERFSKFEMEKKLVQEQTARHKDAEANRFTRHEVKNGILACIGVLDSMKSASKEQNATSQSMRNNVTLENMSGAGLDSSNISLGSTKDPQFISQSFRTASMMEQLPEESLDLSSRRQCSGESSASASPEGIDYLAFEESAGELDHLLRAVLDTITDHAMSREVIYEQYEVRRERVKVPDVLANIRRHSNSAGQRCFPLTCFPLNFPILGIEPRLLRYIYQNAISNACRYGKRDGTVETLVYFDDTFQEFRLEVVNLPGYGHENLLIYSHDEIQDMVFSPQSRLHTNFSDDNDASDSNSSGDGAWIMKKCATMLHGGCELRFEPDRTTFSFWCPAKAYHSREIKETKLKALPPDTWGIVIDDSRIQRKLMDRFLKVAGIEQSRRVVVGKDAEEIHRFKDMVLRLVRENPDCRFLVIADENLDIVEGTILHGSVSGSLCLQQVLEQMEPQDSSRVLALIRSANDSAKETDVYKSRAHGFLVKAPMDKDAVLKAIQPWWVKRFQAVAYDDSSSNLSFDTTDADEYDPILDVKSSLEVVNSLSHASHQKLSKRWRSVQDRLQALKGDLKSMIPRGGPDLKCIIDSIDDLKENGCPENLRDQWQSLHEEIDRLLESH